MNPPSEPFDPNEGFGAIGWGVACLLLAIVVGLVVALTGGDEEPAAPAAPPSADDPDAQTIKPVRALKAKPAPAAEPAP